MIYVLATYRLRTGMLEPFVEHAYSLIDNARREPGCLYYDLHASVTDPERVMCLEQWRDSAAVDSHLASPYVAMFSAAIRDFVVSSKVEIIHPAHVDTL